MLDKFLEEVVVSIVGKPGEELAAILNSKRHVNEFNIATKLDVTINQVRNYLYKLSDEGIVSSIRKKDKKKGWYTYFWRIEVLKALEFLFNSLNQKKDYMAEVGKNREQNEHYACERCNLEFDEQTALLMNFTCEECGGVFTVKDNSKLIKDLKKAVEEIDSKLILVSEEIEKENARLEKEKQKELKKIEKENEAKKLERKLARQKAAEEKKKAKAGSEKKGKTVKKVAKKVATKKTVSKKAVVKKAVKKVAKKASVKKAVKKAVKKTATKTKETKSVKKSASSGKK